MHLQKKTDGNAIKQKTTRSSPVVFAQRAYIIDPLQQAMVFGDTFPVAVKFAVENLFPGAEIEFAFGDGDDHFSPHDLGLKSPD